MANPQPQAFLGPLTEAAIFLVVTVNAGGEEDVREGCSRTSAGCGARWASAGPRRRSPASSASARICGRIFGDPRPAELHPFTEIAGRDHTAVSTPGDLLFHIRAERLDLCFELASA